MLVYLVGKYSLDGADGIAVRFLGFGDGWRGWKRVEPSGWLLMFSIHRGPLTYNFSYFLDSGIPKNLQVMQQKKVNTFEYHGKNM